MVSLEERVAVHRIVIAIVDRMQSQQLVYVIPSRNAPQPVALTKIVRVAKRVPRGDTLTDVHQRHPVSHTQVARQLIRFLLPLGRLSRRDMLVTYFAREPRKRLFHKDHSYPERTP